MLEDLPSWAAGPMQSPLLAAAVIAIIVTLAGSLIGGASPRIGRILRTGGNLALIAVVGMTVIQVARLSNPALDLALPQVGLPAQRVVGSETRVSLSSDGRWWAGKRAGSWSIPARR